MPKGEIVSVGIEKAKESLNSKDVATVELSEDQCAAKLYVRTGEVNNKTLVLENVNTEIADAFYAEMSFDLLPWQFTTGNEVTLFGKYSNSNASVLVTMTLDDKWEMTQYVVQEATEDQEVKEKGKSFLCKDLELKVEMSDATEEYKEVEKLFQNLENGMVLTPQDLANESWPHVEDNIIDVDPNFDFDRLERERLEIYEKRLSNEVSEDLLKYKMIYGK